jgi:hypothetical protein
MTVGTQRFAVLVARRRLGCPEVLGSVPAVVLDPDEGGNCVRTAHSGQDLGQGRTARPTRGVDVEVAAGSRGFLGTTGGVTDDGDVFIAARFESEEAARANGDRPEQGAWWAQTERYFHGPVSFIDSADVDVQVEPSNDARFVQVIQANARDRKRIEEINAEVGPAMTESRPEIIGAVSVWSGDHVCDIAYFTTEEAARAGEKKELAEAHRKLFEEWQSLIDEPTFLDIKEPWLY